jgi:uncharacterized protein
MQSLDQNSDSDRLTVLRDRDELSPNPLAEKEESQFGDRRRGPTRRIVGRLVALSGTRGVVDCRLDPAGEDWSVGHLITVSDRNVRMVGVVTEVATVDGKWVEGETNIARLTCELGGEIIDEPPEIPVFYRGIRSYPPLGAIVHRIRSADLSTIYTSKRKYGVEIGKLTQNNNIATKINIQELVSRHFAIVGSTGVGKTQAATLLVKEAIAAVSKLRIVILDPHDEYATYFQDIAFTVDSDNLDLPIWMFKFDELAELVFSGNAANTDEREALYEIVQMAKAKQVVEMAPAATGGMLRRQPGAEKSSITPDTPAPFRIADAIAIIDEWIGKLDQRYQRGDLRALRSRLDSLSRDPRYKFMFRKSVSEDHLAKVISRLFRIPTLGMPITVIKLAGLPNEVVNSVVSVVARLAFEIAFWCSGSFAVNVLCEEAHRYIPSGEGRIFQPARRAIGRIAKEGRKYGASLGVITPRPSELDPTVLSQCSTTFAMRLVNENDKRIVHDAVGIAALSTLLPSIADREAIAFGEAIVMPMRMKFADMALQQKVQRAGASDLVYIDLHRLASQLRGDARDQGDAVGTS